STGLLTIGNGNGQDITAGNATVDINSAGATENAGSIISASGAASGLRLRGSGTFTLNQANQIDTLAAATNGKVSFNDQNGITVSASGSLTLAANTVIQSTKVTLNAGSAIVINGGGGINASTIVLNSGTDLTLAAGATLNASGGTITANTGQAGVATIRILGNLQANSATFNGGNASLGNRKGDTFVIRPSESRPFSVNGMQ